MKKPSFYIDEDAFRAAVGAGEWAINSLSVAAAKAIRPFLVDGDVIGVFASGTMNPQPDSNGVVAGIDFVRYEKPAKRKSGESELNFYHLAIKAKDERGLYPAYAVKDDGACIAPHWGTLGDIDLYK